MVEHELACVSDLLSREADDATCAEEGWCAEHCFILVLHFVCVCVFLFFVNEAWKLAGPPLRWSQ